MLFYGIAAGCEAIAAAGGWNEPLYRTWYLTGAVWTAGWLGPRDGVPARPDALRLHASRSACSWPALFTFLTAAQARVRRRRARCRSSTSSARSSWRSRSRSRPTSHNERWPLLAAAAVVGATVLSLVLMADDDAAPRRATRSTRRPAPRSATLLPGQLRLLTPFLNITGAFALILGRDLLGLRVHAQAAGARLLARPEPAGRPVPVQPADRAGRDPRQLRRLAAGRRPGARSRAGSTAASRPRILIAIGALRRDARPTRSTGSGRPSWFQLGKFLGVLFLFAGLPRLDRDLPRASGCRSRRRSGRRAAARPSTATSRRRRAGRGSGGPGPRAAGGRRPLTACTADRRGVPRQRAATARPRPYHGARARPPILVGSLGCPRRERVRAARPGCPARLRDRHRADGVRGVAAPIRSASRSC